MGQRHLNEARQYFQEAMHSYGVARRLAINPSMPDSPTAWGDLQLAIGLKQLSEGLDKTYDLLERLEAVLNQSRALR